MNKKEELRQAFFKEHTEKGTNGLPKIATAPYDLFEWFYKQLNMPVVEQCFFCFQPARDGTRCKSQCKMCAESSIPYEKKY